MSTSVGRQQSKSAEVGVPVVRIIRDPDIRMDVTVVFPDGRVSLHWSDFLRARGLSEDAFPSDVDPVGVESMSAA